MTDHAQRRDEESTMRNIIRVSITHALAAALAASGVWGAASGAQGDDASPRGTFLYTRPEKRAPRRNRPAAPKPAAGDRSLGVAYTVYRADKSGAPVRVDPQQVLYSGDRVRLVVEPNSNGYLYVFHAEADGEATMLFPDDRLSSGSNAVTAHVPIQVPSNQEPREDRQWFLVSGEPTTEHLYVVVAREPIAGIPTGKELLGYCSAYPNACPWQPPTAVWKAILERAADQPLVSRSSAFGQRQSAVERDAIARKISLREDAPEPSVIQISQSLVTGVVVARLDLAHR